MKAKYKCVADLQGGDFMVGQVKTAEEWKEWLVAEREENGYERLIDIARSTDVEEVIPLIADWYGLSFEEVKNDEKIYVC